MRHIYRPHENEHLNLDTSLKLTPDEAIALANCLMAVAAEIGGTR